MTSEKKPLYQIVSEWALVVLLVCLILRLQYSYILFSTISSVLLIFDMYLNRSNFNIEEIVNIKSIGVILVGVFSMVGAAMGGDVLHSYFFISIPFFFILVYVAVPFGRIAMHEVVERAMYIGLGLVSVIALFEYFSNFRMIHFRYPDSNHLYIIGEEKFTSIYPNINILSYVLFIYIVILSRRIIEYKNRTQIENVFNVVMIQFSIHAGIFLGSRSFIISIILFNVIFIVCLLMKFSISKFKINLLTIIVFFGFISLSIGLNVANSYFITIFRPIPIIDYGSPLSAHEPLSAHDLPTELEFVLDDNSSRTRLRIVKNYIDFSTENISNFLFGFGSLANYVKVFDGKFGNILHDPHNFFLEIFIGYGSLSAFIFFMLYIYILYRLFSREGIVDGELIYIFMLILLILFPIVTLGSSSAIGHYYVFLILIFIFSFESRARRRGVQI